MTYSPAYRTPSFWSDNALLFLFRGEELLVKVHVDGSVSIPTTNDVPDSDESTSAHYMGTIDGVVCFAAALPESAPPPEGLVPRGLRSVFGHLPDDVFMVAGSALQILRWDEAHRYCGRCGTATIDKADERAKQCPSCSFVVFPRISPAAIVAVVKDDQILLAHSHRFALKIYSTIAGYIEVGESAEQCAHREVLEEVGLRIKNVRYFGSQPWPLSGSLMIAFTAEYESGEIQVDGDEITDARWFSRNELPQLPSPMSIARKLIEWFRSSNGLPSSQGLTR